MNKCTAVACKRLHAGVAESRCKRTTMSMPHTPYILIGMSEQAVAAVFNFPKQTLEHDKVGQSTGAERGITSQSGMWPKGLDERSFCGGRD